MRSLQSTTEDTENTEPILFFRIRTQRVCSVSSVSSVANKGELSGAC
jgi:hypothetical protein